MTEPTKKTVRVYMITEMGLLSIIQAAAEAALAVGKSGVPTSLPEPFVQTLEDVGILVPCGTGRVVSIEEAEQIIAQKGASNDTKH